MTLENAARMLTESLAFQSIPPERHHDAVTVALAICEATGRLPEVQDFHALQCLLVHASAHRRSYPRGQVIRRVRELGPLVERALSAAAQN